MSKGSLAYNRLKEKILLEHSCILSHLEEATKTSNTSNAINELIWLRDNAILKHQYNEEKLIFTKLINKQRLNEGGPFCVLFFDEHVAHSPKDQVKKTIQKDLKYQEHQLCFKAQKSPIDIPLEEHMAIETLINYLLNSQKSDFNNSAAMENLKKLIYKHHEKEEQCFLKVCESLLLPEELDEINELWRPIDC